MLLFIAEAIDSREMWIVTADIINVLLGIMFNK